MKMVSITLEVPKVVDDHFRQEAKKAMVSKSSIIRKILFDHAKTTQSETPQQPNATGEVNNVT